MPHLTSDTGAMRLALDLVQRERLRAPDGGEVGGRVLATAAVEWLDARDGEWWPFVRLPPLWLDPGAAEALVAGLRDVLQGAAPGFGWQAGEGLPLGLQLGAEGGALVVELGVGLGPFLADVAKLAAPGGEAALFRFAAAQAEVVRFAGALEDRLGELATP